MSPFKIFGFIVTFLGLVGIGFYFSWKNFGPPTTSIASTLHTTEQGTAKLGGPFRLKDKTGQYRSDKEFRGKILLIYFGYSYCPDICPTALSSISKALHKLGKDADFIQPLFITIDPGRDTENLLKTYMQDFDPRFIALTGKEEDLLPLKKAYKVYASKVPTADPNDPHYLMDHSSLIYVMDPAGKYITHFSHQTDPALLAKHLKELLTQYFSK